MTDKREPPQSMTIGDYHWKRGDDGRYVMHDGFTGSRYQCGVTESILVERLAESQAEIERLKTENSRTKAGIWLMGLVRPRG